MAQLLKADRDELACPYLLERGATMEYRLLLGVTPPELDAMLERGWRRFGPTYFRPACAACQECVPLRVPTATFHPSRSQRRAVKACADLAVSVDVPCVDAERLDLYARWHAWRERERGWEPSAMSERSYQLEFAFPHPCAREVAFRDGTRLVGVGLCDETPRAWSAAYFFYDPAYAKRSLGTANVCAQLAHARARGLAHVYLGFRVLGCPSLRYKASYRPHELLLGRPAPDEAPAWVSGAC